MKDNSEYTFIIDDEHGGQRMDAVLSSLIEEASRSYIQKLIEGGSVHVDGKTVLSKKEKLKPGQTVSLELPPAVPLEARPEPMELNIVYEDRDLVVVNKPKGLVVHPGAGNESGTLVNGLLYHCKALSAINGVERPGIVHRIDKDTSGLLVVAKSDAAHKGLSEQLSVHSMKRQYRAVVWFSMKEDDGTVDAPLGRDKNNRLRRAVVPLGKPAVTHYNVLERFSGFTEIMARLETGRTHQIRVHMAYRHHPLLGDLVYGPQKQPYGLKGQLLHAELLGFVHPITGQYMEFQVDPPMEYMDIIEKLRLRR